MARSKLTQSFDSNWKSYLVPKYPDGGVLGKSYVSFEDVLNRNELVGKLKGLKLSKVLRRSTLDKETYFVDPEFVPHVLAMGEFLSAGNFSSHHSESPGNASSFEFHTSFLDGGVSHYSGNYFCGPPRGTWANGMNAVRLLCFELGLPQPPKRSFENRKPTHLELLQEATNDSLDEPEKMQLERVQCIRD